jgi:CheY-like chemotaxis protein
MLDWDQFRTWSILVVEDEPDNAEVAQAALRLYGAQSHLATNGLEGLKLVDAGLQPDLILLDLSMPQMDGWEMHRRLREDPRTRSTVIVALSAHAMTGDKERVIAAGFDGYLSKPISIITLLQDLRATLEEPRPESTSPVPTEVPPPTLDGLPPMAQDASKPVDEKEAL